MNDDKNNDNYRFNIVRYYISGRKRIIHRDVSFKVAQLHCNDPKSQKEGEWFDGFQKR